MHGVDVEGKQLGIDEELVALLGASSPLPVTYAGGVRSLVRPNAEHICARQADLHAWLQGLAVARTGSSAEWGVAPSREAPWRRWGAISWDLQ